MEPLVCFSESYETARRRFVDGLNAAGFVHEAHAIRAVGPNGEDLTIDVGIRGSTASRRALVISSGLHGVEGFFGSAVQIALLNDEKWDREAEGMRIIMIHALNPFGFAWKRRWNEDNVDLNRSFFSEMEQRPETLPAFHKIDAVLNPRRPPDRFDFFPLTAAWFIARHGFSELKRTLPVGQYDNPMGLFYGGQAPSATQGILEENLRRWIGSASDVMHLDFHTGLGRSGEYSLLLSTPLSTSALTELNKRFGAKVIGNAAAQTQPREVESPSGRTVLSPLERFLARSGIVYPAHGLMSVWLPKLLSDVHYLTLTAEFGTYPAIRVLQSLVAENRSYHWGRLGCSMKTATDDLLEMFAPASPNWRKTTLAAARKICMQAI